jgi:hypothetical protein
MGKLFVSAVADWRMTPTPPPGGFPEIIVSVETPEGLPAAGLHQNEFRVGTVGVGTLWKEQKITGFHEEGSQAGFYQLILHDKTWQLPDIRRFRFTVEVTRLSSGRPPTILDRGQAIAINSVRQD